jgi:hypothetical protein
MLKFHLLEMSLTRNWSILPGDLADASGFVVQSSFVPFPNPDQEEEVVEEDEELDDGVQKPSDISRLTETEAGDGLMKPSVIDVTETTPISAYFLLASAVISLSSIGPILDLRGDLVGSTMKVFWRTSSTSAVLFPFAVYSIQECGLPKLDVRHWVMFVLTAAAYAGLCVFFVWALAYTAVGNAVIISNPQALILLVAKVFMGSEVSFLEGSGASMARIVSVEFHAVCRVALG